VLAINRIFTVWDGLNPLKFDQRSFFDGRVNSATEWLMAMPIRTDLAATTILVTLVAATMGVANRGETAEQTLDEACESAVWPVIPATCFGRQQVRDVYQPGDTVVQADAPRLVAAQKNSPNPTGTGKTDLLQSIGVDDAQYRTLERRADGVSILTRVKVQ
jgi:hypothetical protein